ncbi:hypothetical protein OIU84_014301 [Salix udensis]|uniref:Uncharacterized protein n=1 Tax=Salix udensis TaxID=889485 RepID=A0AAD6JDF0_9ROSI|nr:hypothetical protein OIU84_014301 [Salix udensis]KAJ6402184.1 hypothetical protein OIU84_014301 [Salix udensis]
MATVSSESLPETKAAASITDSETAPKPQAIYRCKRCRRIVASEENIVPHERGKGEQCFKWNKKSVDSCKRSRATRMLFYICRAHEVDANSTRRFCGGETSVHGLQSALGFLQLGRHAMQLWNVDQSCVSTSQK